MGPDPSDMASGAARALSTPAGDGAFCERIHGLHA
jgi:hypothetical protein